MCTQKAWAFFQGTYELYFNSIACNTLMLKTPLLHDIVHITQTDVGEAPTSG